MEYAIFPIKKIGVVQKHYSKPSHINRKAIDIVGSNNEIESAFAPCTCKALKILSKDSHTALFSLENFH